MAEPQQAPAAAPLSHTRVPKAARDLCRSRAEYGCVCWLWDQADEARWEPFPVSVRDFCDGSISAGAAQRLLSDLTAAGLVVVIEPGQGRRASILAVRNPTTGETLRSREVDRERKPNATRTQRERNVNAQDDGGNSVVDGSEETTRTQAERNANASRTYNARAEDHPPSSILHPPDQEQHSSADAVLPPADADGSPPGALTPTEQARKLWDAWEPRRAKTYRGREGKLTASRQQAMAARIREHGVEDVATVVAWWLTSEHQRAVYLRANGYTWGTVLRPENFASYLDLATAAPSAGQQRGQTTAPTEDPAEAVWQKLQINILSGPSALDAAPSAVTRALDAVGGYRALSTLTHPADQARFRAAFLTAYRREAAA